jgi:hypothetical protein
MQRRRLQTGTPEHGSGLSNVPRRKTMKTHGKTVAPRLPEVMREKMKSGGSHKPEKDYDRKREKASLRKLLRSQGLVFLFSISLTDTRISAYMVARVVFLVLYLFGRLPCRLEIETLFVRLISFRRFRGCIGSGSSRMVR